jgi:lipoprotein-releasing system permease protein
MNLLFAWRYFKSKKSTNVINIIAWISVVAIAVGTAALIIVLSVFNGFEDLVKGLYSDFYADMKITPASGKVMVLTKDQLQRLQQLPGVARYSLVAEEKALLVNGEYQTIVYVKGIEDSYRLTNNIAGHIIRGNYNLGTADAPKLLVGAGIENAAGIDVERSLFQSTLYMPNRRAESLSTVQDAMNAYNLNASGTFMIQQEFDNKYVFTNLPFIKYMLDMKPDEYSSVEIKINGRYPDKVKKAIEQLLGKSYTVQTRYEQNQSLYTIMMMEKWVIYAILCLILVVAAFNMIGSLTMLVLEKQKDIAVLKAMGATSGKIRQLFLGEGLLLASIGGLAGVLLAMLICWLQLKFHLLKLQGGSFIIDYYPVKMHPADFGLVTATVVTVAVLAAWLPARKASLQHFSLKS